jgi:SET domain-containing protein
MANLEKHLRIRTSTLPGAGRGLFNTAFIPKGSRITEYIGEILTWKEVQKMEDERNGYVFYVNSRHVIDAWNYKKAPARFANDARGMTRIKGLRNNAEYTVFKKRCWITATRDIPCGSEIFVDYGPEYWQVIRYNLRLELKNRAKAGLNRNPIESAHRMPAKRLPGV